MTPVLDPAEWAPLERSGIVVNDPPPYAGPALDRLTYLPGPASPYLTQQCDLTGRDLNGMRYLRRVAPFLVTPEGTP